MEITQDEYIELLEIANLWMFKAKAATEMAIYLNSLHMPGSDYMDKEDLKKEIESQAKRLFDMSKKGFILTLEKKVA